MENQVDVRGMECPLPVITTKKALEKTDVTSVVTIVDNEIARDNVVRYAESMNYGVEVDQKENSYYIHICKEALGGMEISQETNSDLLYMITADKLGRGEDQLGNVLMRSFFYSLAESDIKPGTIIFMNAGVKLVSEGSPVLTELVALEKKGTKILACGTCLDYYKLKEKLCIGSVSNMYAILDQMHLATKVITL